jgi:hypothetical protein
MSKLGVREREVSVGGEPLQYIVSCELAYGSHACFRWHGSTCESSDTAPYHGRSCYDSRIRRWNILENPAIGIIFA